MRSKSHNRLTHQQITLLSYLFDLGQQSYISSRWDLSGLSTREFICPWRHKKWSKKTYLAYAFSSSAGQNWSLWRLCTKASLPWTAGNLSSTRTSTHAPHHHNRNLNTPAYSAVGEPGGSPPLPKPWSAGTTL